MPDLAVTFWNPKRLARSAAISLATLVLVMTGSAAGASMGGDATGWSDRGIFVLGPYVFDFKLGWIRTQSGSSALEDCSDETFYCAKSKPLELVLPRECVSIDQGDRWTVNGVTTEVLRKEVGVPQEILGGAPLPADQRVLYLLTTPGSDVVYRYNPKFGVEQIWFLGGASPLQFVNVARERGIVGLIDLIKSAGYYPAGLATFEAFGKCAP